MKERDQQEKRENALLKITAHFDRSNDLLHEIEKTVGKEDPLCKTFATVLGAYKNAFDNMEKLVEKGKRISTLQMEKFQL